MVRLVRIASVSFSGTGGGSTSEVLERNLKAMVKLLKRAILDEPDIICFPECSPMLGLPNEKLVEAAQDRDGKVFRTMAELARERETYIVCPMMERVGDKVYNSAVLIGRDGEYIGSYHKIHPTIGEIEAGVTPGVEPKTFKLDFGTVGFAICFDLNFEDVIKSLTENGAELVFFPSMYPGGLQLKIWAFNYGIYMVSAYTGEGSMIVDPLGRVLATSSAYSTIISKTINLDYEVFHLDYNYTKFEDMKRKYGSGIELDVIRPEATFMLTSNLKDVTVKDLIREFGLETRKEYFKRALRVRTNALKTQD